MICTIDVGNTKTKAILFDENLDIISEKSWETPDLFDPERWQIFFDTLNRLNPLFYIADLRISCVSWRAFLALKVYLKYDLPTTFDTYKKFNPDLLILPPHSPVISEATIPINRNFITGLIGTDRLLSAYATYKIFKQSSIVVSLGTATTIDLITNTGVFLSGAILPGIDVSYQGLLNRATYLPSISELKDSTTLISVNTYDALYNGLFIGQGILIEEYSKRMIEEAALQGKVNLTLTGGRSSSVSSHIINYPYKIIKHLVNYGLALLPNWKNSNTKIYSEKKIATLAEKLNKKQ